MSIDRRSAEEVADVFRAFYEQPENKHCFECNELVGEWVSANNAIALCDKCASIHRTWGDHVSALKSHKSDPWTWEELMYIRNGGNLKLQQFYDSFFIGKHTPMAFKYQTRAGYFYRRQLRDIVAGKPLPIPPPKNRALELIEHESFLDDLSENASKGLAGVTHFLTGIYDSAKHTIQDSNFPGNLKDKAVSVKNDTVLLASRSFEAVKEGVNSAVHYIQEKTSSHHEEPKPEVQHGVKVPDNMHIPLAEDKPKIEEKAEEHGLKGSLIHMKDKVEDTIHSAYEGIKDGIHRVEDLIKEKIAPKETPERIAEIQEHAAKIHEVVKEQTKELSLEEQGELILQKSTLREDPVVKKIEQKYKEMSPKAEGKRDQFHEAKRFIEKNVDKDSNHTELLNEKNKEISKLHEKISLEETKESFSRGEAQRKEIKTKTPKKKEDQKEDSKAAEGIKEGFKTIEKGVQKVEKEVEHILDHKPEGLDICKCKEKQVMDDDVKYMTKLSDETLGCKLHHMQH